MANRTVKRLYDLEIDEISLVDRSANQHADVAIAKRDEGTSMTVLMDAEGYVVSEDQLEPGMVVYDAESGEELVACEEGASPEDYFQDDETETEDEGAEVGKAFNLNSLKGAGRSFKRGVDLSRVGTKGEIAQDSVRNGGRALRAGGAAGRNRGKLAVGGGAAALAGGGYAVGKSLGADVYEELSKALGSDERDQVISKAMEQARAEADEARKSADEAWNIAKSLQDEREIEELTEIAKGYGLPGDPYEIALVLKSAVDTMPAEHVQYLDRLFAAAGEQIYDELGSGLGPEQSSVMAQIEAMAGQAVGKADVSEAQAIVELFATNDGAYEAYLSETR
jgi:hypothetical protein